MPGGSTSRRSGAAGFRKDRPRSAGAAAASRNVPHSHIGASTSVTSPGPIRSIESLVGTRTGPTGRALVREERRGLHQHRHIRSNLGMVAGKLAMIWSRTLATAINAKGHEYLCGKTIFDSDKKLFSFYFPNTFEWSTWVEHVWNNLAALRACDHDVDIVQGRFLYLSCPGAWHSLLSGRSHRAQGWSWAIKCLSKDLSTVLNKLGYNRII